MRVLIIGCGSIGRRHLANLQRLGRHDVIAYRTRRDRSEELAASYGVRSYYSLPEALAQRPAMAIIANPTSLHVPMAREALRAGCHVFIEKPLSHSMEGVEPLLQEAGTLERVVMVGYQLRFHPLLRWVKAQLDAGVIGRVVSVRAQVGQYLPDWHPWEDYRQGYYGRQELGGGAVLTLSHELDYVLWWLGTPETVACLTARGERFGIDTEDAAEIVLRFASGALGSIHMDYYQRTITRTCQVVGEDGLLDVDLKSGRARCFLSSQGQWTDEAVPAGYTDDEMYRAELEHFIECVEGRAACRVDGHAGRLTLQVALAAKEASETGRTVAIHETARA